MGGADFQRKESPGLVDSGMVVWSRWIGGNRDNWQLGEAFAMVNSGFSAGRGVLQSIGHSGCRTNHQVAGQPWWTQ